jgi:hypothetical protein
MGERGGRGGARQRELGDGSCLIQTNDYGSDGQYRLQRAPQADDSSVQIDRVADRLSPASYDPQFLARLAEGSSSPDEFDRVAMKDFGMRQYATVRKYIQSFIRVNALQVL